MVNAKLCKKARLAFSSSESLRRQRVLNANSRRSGSMMFRRHLSLYKNINKLVPQNFLSLEKIETASCT